MASRRDELNAYTFAKRRLIAQFLQPNPSGSEEGAPVPCVRWSPERSSASLCSRCSGPGDVQARSAPEMGHPYENVIIASKSTTRYVVLKTDGKTQLHPVLNMSSAKLLLAPDKGTVINVNESVLDSGKIPHGATLGIPYAPTGCRTRRKPDRRSGGPSASGRSRAAGPSRRRRSSSRSASRRRPTTRAGCRAAS
ncbi:type VII secretion protein EccB [Streptomyces sp. M10(2022)]